jgi:hypothetical protein
MALTFDVPVGQDVKSSDSYTALTPLAFLERSLDVFADKTAIAYGDRRLGEDNTVRLWNADSDPLQLSGRRQTRVSRCTE